MTKGRNPAITWASVLLFVSAARWLIFDVPTVLYILSNREIPIFFGIRALSGPISEILGIDAVLAAEVPYGALHLLGVVAGYLLWKSKRLGGILGISVIGFSSFFWIGFAVPYGPLIGIPNLYLIISGWKTLH